MSDKDELVVCAGIAYAVVFSLVGFVLLLLLSAMTDDSDVAGEACHVALRTMFGIK